MAKKLTSIVVMVTDDKLGSINQVADQLVAKGMKVNQVLPITGVISGSAPATKMAALEKVNGVMSVEKEAVASLPPSNSVLQ